MKQQLLHLLPGIRLRYYYCNQSFCCETQFTTCVHMCAQHGCKHVSSLGRHLWPAAHVIAEGAQGLRKLLSLLIAPLRGLHACKDLQ
jgi:hypothetical protein